MVQGSRRDAAPAIERAARMRTTAPYVDWHERKMNGFADMMTERHKDGVGLSETHSGDIHGIEFCRSYWANLIIAIQSLGICSHIWTMANCLFEHLHC